MRAEAREEIQGEKVVNQLSHCPAASMRVLGTLCPLTPSWDILGGLAAAAKVRGLEGPRLESSRWCWLPWGRSMACRPVLEGLIPTGSPGVPHGPLVPGSRWAWES